MDWHARFVVVVSLSCVACSQSTSENAAGFGGAPDASSDVSASDAYDAPSDRASFGEWPATPDAPSDVASESANDGQVGDGDSEPPVSDDAKVEGHTLPGQLTCMQTSSATVTMRNTGSTTWEVNRHRLAYVGGLAHPFVPTGGPTVVSFSPAGNVEPGQSATFTVQLLAPPTPATHEARFRMLLDGTQFFGTAASRDITVGAGCSPSTSCSFPQGVPDGDFIDMASAYGDTHPAVDAVVNEVMELLSGCGVMSDCPLTGFPGANEHEICQSWFAAVTAELRARGYFAGQHVEGHTDEIAVSNTSCAGHWYGYHICNYGGAKVVWNPGARRGWWQIDPSWCQ